MSVTSGLPLLQRQLLALNCDDLVLDEWSHRFVADVCWRKPETLTERQVAMVHLLCWRQRDHLPAELVPAAEPKLPGSDPRAPGPHPRGSARMGTDRRPLPRPRPRKPR